MDEQFQVEDLAEKAVDRRAICDWRKQRKNWFYLAADTQLFAEGCNRVRMTCTGMLYMCLGQDDHADLRAVIRDGNESHRP